MLATAGIESVVRLWEPSGEATATKVSRQEAVLAAAANNRLMSDRESTNGGFPLSMLNYIRAALATTGDDDDDDDDESDRYFFP